MDRRAYLAALGTTATVGLAGCSGGDDGDSSGPDTADPDAEVLGGRTTTEATTTEPTTTPARVADVEIEGDELIKEEREFGTDVYVAATVTNSGPVASGSISLAVNWFDQEDSYIEDSTIYCNTLGAGETWAARIYANTLEPDRFANYELAGEVDERSPIAPGGLEVADSRLLAGDREAKVTGTVTNIGDGAVEYAEAIAKLYNSDGQIITTEFTNEADIAAGAEWSVELTAILLHRADAVDDHALVLAGGR